MANEELSEPATLGPEWSPGAQAIFMIDREITDRYLPVMEAVGEWYARSREYEEWFDPSAHGRLELLFAWSDVEAAKPGRVRVLAPRGGDSARVTYGRLIEFDDAWESDADELWRRMLGTYEAAFTAVGARLRLAPGAATASTDDRTGAPPVAAVRAGPGQSHTYPHVL